jgi:DNA-binding NarL/FixJ family response regulator
MEVARQIQETVPTSEILVMSEHGAAMMEAAFRAGARGYLLKSDSWHELVSAVRRVNSKQHYVSQRFGD